MRRPPEQTVVDNQEVCLNLDGLVDGGKGAVHGGGDLADSAAVLDLQTIDRSRPVRELFRLQATIAIANDGWQRALFHGAELYRKRLGMSVGNSASVAG